MKSLFVGLLLFLSSFAFSQEENARPEILSIYHGLDPILPEQLVFAVYHLQQIRMACR